MRYEELKKLLFKHMDLGSEVVYSGNANSIIFEIEKYDGNSVSEYVRVFDNNVLDELRVVSGRGYRYAYELLSFDSEGFIREYLLRLEQRKEIRDYEVRGLTYKNRWLGSLAYEIVKREYVCGELKEAVAIKHWLFDAFIVVENIKEHKVRDEWKQDITYKVYV